jgi:formate dehydrogenase major subunit
VFQKAQHYARHMPRHRATRASRPRRSQIVETFAQPARHVPARWDDAAPVGVQNIRCYGILQLLLGNIGKPGGGVNALRGEPNVQGACDFSVLNNYWFGYCDYPVHTEPTLAVWTKHMGTINRAMVVNGLKAWFGENATPENEFGFGWLPATRRTTARMIDDGYAGSSRCGWSAEPAVTNPTCPTREAFASLSSWWCRSCGDRDGGLEGPAPIRRSRPSCTAARRSSWRRRARSPTPAPWCSGGRGGLSGQARGT